MPQRPPRSSQLCNAQINTPEQKDTYIALLERRNHFLNHNELKLRALLELATGISWDSEDIAGLEGEALEVKVAENMARGLSMTISQARDVVKRHRDMANHAQLKSPLPVNGQLKTMRSRYVQVALSALRLEF